MRNKESYILETVDCLNENQSKIDDLLYEAVERDAIESVRAILNHITIKETPFDAEHLGHGHSDCNASSSLSLKWKKKLNVRAVILAAQKGNYELIKIFLSYGFRIEIPHDILCRCWKCKHDLLGSTKKRIVAYSALCNPIWISLSSKDPFTTAFGLSRQLERLQWLEESYENTFSTLRIQVQTYCMDLLDCVENSTEQYKVVNMIENDDYGNDEEVGKRKWSLKLIRRAFQYKLKKIVAHPILQHVVTSLVYDSVPEWRSGGTMRRLAYIMGKSITFPFTALAYLFFPCSSLGRSSQSPLVRFINGASSLVTFLGLLALLAALPARGLRTGNPPSALEWIIFIWVISLLVAEIIQLTQVGWYRYFRSGWNLMDLFMILFMLASFTIWAVLFFAETTENRSKVKTARSIANGLFTCGTIMSFFRLVYLCQITRFLGLLQLCLGKMIEVIFQFAFISCVVLWSFSVGMVFLHNTLHTKGDSIDAHNELMNKSDVQVILSKGFDGLPTTMVTLAWASLNMVGLGTLKDFDDGGVVYLWSSVLFTLYYGVSMIILLNMLIAMMSNSYQQIENNIEVEHKYAKTQLLVDYIIPESFLPCPFNLIPNWHCFKKLNGKVLGKSDKSEEIESEQHHGKESEYEKTTKILVERYLLKKHKVKVVPSGNDQRQPQPQNDEFDARVQSFIESLKQRVLSMKIPSFEDSGLDISFNGEQNADSSSYMQSRR